MELFELADRWMHLLAGVLWIGFAFFLNWVIAAFVLTLDAETKRKVSSELMPRALWWIRWGALLTWLTGFILLFVTYYHGYDGANLFDGQHPRALPSDWGPAFGGLFLGFFIYDVLFTVLKRQHALAVVLLGLMTLGFAYFLHNIQGFSDRAVYIHMGALFGTAMAANVWMRIGPAQSRILRAIHDGEAPAPEDVGSAGLRSKHNTYMAISLLLFMVGSGQSAMYTYGYLETIAVVLSVSFVLCWALYAKAKTVPGL